VTLSTGMYAVRPGFGGRRKAKRSVAFYDHDKPDEDYHKQTNTSN